MSALRRDHRVSIDIVFDGIANGMDRVGLGVHEDRIELVRPLAASAGWLAAAQAEPLEHRRVALVAPDGIEHVAKPRADGCAANRHHEEMLFDPRELPRADYALGADDASVLS